MEAWTAVKQSDSTWVFTWDADSGVSYDIWLYGILLDTVDEGEYTCTEPDYEDTSAPLEIVVEDASAENDDYPPYAALQWAEVEDASAYVVSEYVVDEWIARSTVMQADVGYYGYVTLRLEDEDEVIFKVEALDTNGNEGTAITYTFSVVCNPIPPETDISIAAGLLTAEEA